MELRISARIARLYNGRRSLYASITIGRRSWFVSRWDTLRVDPAKHWQIHRGAAMTWYAGSFGA